MVALADAVPTWMNTVTVLADGNTDGRKGARALVDRLHARGFDGDGQVLLCEVRK
jgi:hypothetical protein